MIYVVIIIVVVIILGIVGWRRIYGSRKVATEAFLSTFNGKMDINSQYFYDTLFDDVTYYPNDSDEDIDSGKGSFGCTKCRLNIPPGGHCVEYGLTNICYGFSY